MTPQAEPQAALSPEVLARLPLFAGESSERLLRRLHGTPNQNNGFTVILTLVLLGGAAYVADAHLPGLLAELQARGQVLFRASQAKRGGGRSNIAVPEADAVLVQKAERKLYLMQNGKPYREYAVAFGADPQGHKQQEGDERTPEGEYVLDWRNPNSAYHLSIHVSYPNKEDKARAATQGVSAASTVRPAGVKYDVTVPDLPGCFSAGEMLDQAVENACEAIDAHVELLAEEGAALPAPRPLSEHQQDPTSKVSFGASPMVRSGATFLAFDDHREAGAAGRAGAYQRRRQGVLVE